MRQPSERTEVADNAQVGQTASLLAPLYLGLCAGVWALEPGDIVAFILAVTIPLVFAARQIYLNGALVAAAAWGAIGIVVMVLAWSAGPASAPGLMIIAPLLLAAVATAALLLRRGPIPGVVAIVVSWVMGLTGLTGLIGVLMGLYFLGGQSALDNASMMAVYGGALSLTGAVIGVVTYRLVRVARRVVKM